jgi:hypothetical protein
MKNHLRVILSVLALASLQAYGRNLVLNGNFATGDFTDWTLSGNLSNPYYGVSQSTSPPDTGIPPLGAAYYAYLGPDPPPTFLSQTITTTPGAEYTFSFYVSHSTYDGVADAEFTASFGSDEVFDTIATPIPTWTLESYTVLATTPTILVQFSSVSPPGYYYLDDVSVTPYTASSGVPDVASTFGLLGAALAGLSGLRRKLA